MPQEIKNIAFHRNVEFTNSLQKSNKEMENERQKIKIKKLVILGVSPSVGVSEQSNKKNKSNNSRKFLRVKGWKSPGYEANT